MGADHPFCAEITWLVGEGITTGFGDGGFHPTAPVSRQAMAAFLFRTGPVLVEAEPCEGTVISQPECDALDAFFEATGGRPAPGGRLPIRNAATGSAWIARADTSH